MVSVDSWWDGLARGRFQAVLELVLDAIADDYESLDIILKAINEDGSAIDAGSWAARAAVPVSRPEVVRALRELTLEGYAQAYILETREPYSTPTEFLEAGVGGLWFYATPKGIDAVRQFLGSE